MTTATQLAIKMGRWSKDKLKQLALAEFRKFFGDPDMTWKEVKYHHFHRNDYQKANVDFASIIDTPSKYELLADDVSLFHQFNFRGDKGNKSNVKFASLNGHHEYVYGFKNGEIQIVRSELNMGTYNYAAHTDGIAHLKMDVATWLVLGNTEKGLAGWGYFQRKTDYRAAGPKKLFSDDEAFPKETLSLSGNSHDNDWIGVSKKIKYVGKAGDDTVDYSGAGTSIAVNLDVGKGFFGNAKGDQFKSIENIKGSKYGDILIGDGSDNTFTGNGGKDQFSGKGGDDTFVVSDRKFKSVIGGKGQDVLEIAKNGPKSIDFSKLKSVEVLDLRNINPENFDFSNVKGIKEVWVDELFDVKGYSGNAKFVYFGNEELTFDLYPGSPLSEELFGGHEFSLGEPAKGEASFSITIHINMHGLFGSSEPEWLELYALAGTDYYHDFGDSTEQLQVTGSTESGFLNMFKWLTDGVGPAFSERGFELTSSVNLFKLFQATGSDRAFDFKFSELEEIANSSTSNQIETLREHTYELMIALFTDAAISGGVQALAPDSFPSFSLLLE